MRRREFIDMILNSISDTFDIYHNYWFEGRKFVIYAYSYNKKDRFSTTDDAKLWDSKCYEHLFFINCDTLGMKELDDLYDFAVNKIHMYTHISFIIITRNQVLPDVEKALKSKNYSKNYMFGARGFSNIRLACVTPSRYSVISNKAGTKIAEFLTEILLHIDYYEE